MMKEKLQFIHKLLLEEEKIKTSTNEKIVRIGLTVPVVRKKLKQDLSFFGESPKDVLNAWDMVWKETPYFEGMSLCLYYYQYKSLSKAEFNKVKLWIDRCDCWEHSDDLSKIYAQVFEENPEWVMPVLKKWNKSKNLWKRRQSVVSLLEYSRKRKKVQSFNILISFVENLLFDKEYYVQKGIGWTLREIYNIYPKQTLRFIKTNLKDISPVAYTAATEKIDKVSKKSLNESRKVLRKKTT